MASFYINAHGPDTQLLVRGVVNTLSLAKASSLRQAAVAAYTKGQVSKSDIWEDAIGELPARKLAKGVMRVEGCTLHLIKERIERSGIPQVRTQYIAQLSEATYI